MRDLSRVSLGTHNERVERKLADRLGRLPGVSRFEERVDGNFIVGGIIQRAEFPAMDPPTIINFLGK